MSERQLVLDTETTGLKVEEGHRIIEVACVELIDRKLTGNHFHYYVNPEREIEAGAVAVHGITNHFLQDKPRFVEIAQAFIDFITGAELIIHNAAFDVSFLNNELSLTQLGFKSLSHYCKITDTLQMARQLHVGQRNSLDALCKRYGVDNSKREWHGALLDAHLLKEVYLAMTGGQGNFFDSLSQHPTLSQKSSLPSTKTSIKKTDLIILEANAQELEQHQEYLSSMQNQGKCLWLTLLN